MANASGIGKNSSDVVTCHSIELADELWHRVKDHVPEALTIAPSAGEYGAEGSFRAVGIVPTFRFMRYSAGQAFRPHLDPHRYKRKNPFTGEEGYFQSFFTLALYLNEQDQFEGEALNFVELKLYVDQSKGGLPIKRMESIASVKPAVGRCAIFNHRELHEGGELRAGVKHMMQCDVLYEWLGPWSLSCWENNSDLFCMIPVFVFL
jgi:hypothetical protein